MLGNYLKISTRIIFRNRLFSFINIAGLAVSMTVGLMLIALFSEMSRYDDFHANYDGIYRVISEREYLGQEANRPYASTSLRAGQAIRESIPGIEDVAILYRGFKGDLQSGDKTVPLSGHWANESFFNVFTFPMISGDPSTALKEPYSIVLTETSAEKLFGRTNVLGESVSVLPGQTLERELIVTGVIQDVPRSSHIKFDVLVSLSTRELYQRYDESEMWWTNIFRAYVYLLLPEGTDLQNLQRNLEALSAKENRASDNTAITLSLQPLSKIAMGEGLINSLGPVMLSSNVWIIGILSTIVILLACFNYTNLSVARSLRRSREVGIRKVVGARKNHVMGQFLIEAIIIALCALVFSFVLFVLLKPYFLSLDDQYAQMLVLDLSPELLLYFLGLAIAVGIAAGLFPALFFARVNAIRVLKNISAAPVFRRVTMRKALIVVQFTISLMFIAATIIGYKHYKHLLAFDLGFETENILNIRLFDNKANVLMNELSEIPEIQMVSTSSTITNVGMYGGTYMKYDNPLDSASVYFASIDEHYLSLHGHRFLAGKNFTPKPDSAAESEVIVNEQVLKRFNIGGQKPLDAIGEIITVNARKLQIIGVLKNFYYGKPETEVKEFIFRYGYGKPQYLNAKIVAADWQKTLDKIQHAWKKVDDIHPLEAAFYDDQIAHTYRSFSSRVKVIGILSFLSICIACFGLLGMVVFTTETRLKEISIRKVMGAGEASLVFLLSRNFLALLFIAGLIALPATHLFFLPYALDEYVDRVAMPWSELIGGVACVMVISFLMIGAHTLKAARANPGEVLKNE